jgi:hypothetical protein
MLSVARELKDLQRQQRHSLGDVQSTTSGQAFLRKYAHSMKTKLVQLVWC